MNDSLSGISSAQHMTNENLVVRVIDETINESIFGAQKERKI